MKNIYKLLLGIAFLVSLVINLHLLFSAADYVTKGVNEINWSWLFDTESHHWGILIANLIFSLSNLMFFIFSLMFINENFLKDNSHR
jgi:uncharacterized membrane-anchored protein YitT (DUF2179 family)